MRVCPDLLNGMDNERNGGFMKVQMNCKKGMWILALALGIGFAGITTRVAASPSPQEQHDQDYSKNKNYQTGVRDGRSDQTHNRDHYKKRTFKKDDDKQAYESGYQSSRQTQDHR